MAASSRDGSVHGATSLDDALTLPSHVETFGRAIAPSVGETVRATHRARRRRSAHNPSPQVAEERLGLVASATLAVVSLLFVSAVALCSMLVSAAILHLASPDRRFDAFRAFHEPLVIGLLFGLGVLWLLPPYPWTVKPAQDAPKKRRLFRAKADA
jgi:hypothetical protein